MGFAEAAVRAGESLVVGKRGVIAGVDAKQLLTGGALPPDMASIVGRHRDSKRHGGAMVAFDFGPVG